MKKTDVNKNIQLIRCWSDIQQWIKDNNKIDVTIQMESGVVNIEGENVSIEQREGEKFFVIQRKHFYRGLKRNTLLSLVRTTEKPFKMLEELILKWESYKVLIKQENEKNKRIFNFKV